MIFYETISLRASLSAIHAENQHNAKQTPSFTPKNAKLGVFIFYNLWIVLRIISNNRGFLYLCTRLSTDKTMKKRFATLFAAVACVYAVQAEKPMSGVTFDASKGVAGSVTMPNGQVVNYTAYTDLYYVANVEDSTYQRMNLFVPVLL